MIKKIFEIPIKSKINNDKCLFIFDEYLSYLSIKFIDYCDMRIVIFVILFSYSTH